MQSDGVATTYKSGKRNRRLRAISRLKEQLVSGIKPASRKQLKGLDAFEYSRILREGFRLTDSDKERMKKEIETLQSKT